MIKISQKSKNTKNSLNNSSNLLPIINITPQYTNDSQINNSFTQKVVIKKLLKENPNFFMESDEKEIFLDKIIDPNFYNRNDNKTLIIKKETRETEKNPVYYLERNYQNKIEKILRDHIKILEKKKNKLKIAKEENSILKISLKNFEEENFYLKTKIKGLSEENEKKVNECEKMKKEFEFKKTELYKLEEEKNEISNIKKLNNILFSQTATIKKEFETIIEEKDNQLKKLKEENDIFFNIFKNNKNSELIQKEIEKYRNLKKESVIEKKSLQLKKSIIEEKDFLELLKKKMDDQEKELLKYDKKDKIYQDKIKYLKTRNLFLNFRIVALMSEFEKFKLI